VSDGPARLTQPWHTDTEFCFLLHRAPFRLDADVLYAKNSMMSDEAQRQGAVKPLVWIGSSLGDLREFPEEVRQTMGFALWQAQNGARHVDAKPLAGFGGAGVLEIVEGGRGGTFRGVYTVEFAGVVYALHAFQKKSKKGVKTPQRDMDLIRRRLKMAEQHYEEWRSSQASKRDKK